MPDLPPEWRAVGSRPCAWFAASSHAHAASLAERLPAGAPAPDLDIRADGVRVRADAALAEIAAAAGALGLTADPAVLQEVRLRIDSPAPAAVTPFWRTALNHADSGDRWRRNPVLRFERADDPRPLRNRIHLDSGHPGPVDDVAQALKAGGGSEIRSSQWYSTIADPDGNEVDVVPGGALGGESTSDWTAMFGGMACYPGTSPRQAAELAVAAGRLADEAGIPLMIDVRPEGVVLDSGKDQWEMVAGFTDLAAAVQQAARSAGLAADNSGLRFVQIGIDAVDIPSVRGFWRSALGYVPSPETRITDLYDPRQLDPVVFLQPMDPTETDRRRQRNRTAVELLLPAEQLSARLDVAVGAGGRLLDEAAERYVVADPEGNELVLLTTEDGRG